MVMARKTIRRVFIVAGFAVTLLVLILFWASHDSSLYVTLQGYTAKELEGVTVQIGGYTLDGTEPYIFPMDTLDPLDEDTFVWRDACVGTSFDGHVDIVVKRYSEKLHASRINLRPFWGRYLNNKITFKKSN